MARPRGHLCSRCGAVVNPPEFGGDGTATGACPECGLEFSAAVLTARRPLTPLGPWRAARSRRRLGRGPHEIDAILRALPFPIYGLATSWTGNRWPGGYGGSGGTGHIELGHGDPFDLDAPMIRVDTRRSDPQVSRWIAKKLAEHVWHETGEYSEPVRAPFASDDPTAGWDDVALSVAGGRVTFRALTSDLWWVALGTIGDFIVSVEARHFDPSEVELDLIEDASAYLPGAD